MLAVMSQQIITCLTVLLLAVILPKTVHSFASFDPLVSCIDITTEGSESFRVCSPNEIYGPSPISFENATGEFTEYAGGWTHPFIIYNASAEGFDENTPNMQGDPFPAEASANMRVTVRREDNNTCSVTVLNTANGMDYACNSCTYCGDFNEPPENQMGCVTCGTYSADCTNLENGRMVECESIATVFFPFTEDALPPRDDDGPEALPTPPRPSPGGGGGMQMQMRMGMKMNMRMMGMVRGMNMMGGGMMSR